MNTKLIPKHKSTCLHFSVSSQEIWSHVVVKNWKNNLSIRFLCTFHRYKCPRNTNFSHSLLRDYFYLSHGKIFCFISGITIVEMSSRGKGDSRGHESQKLPDGLKPLGKKGPEHKTGMLTSRKLFRTPVVFLFSWSHWPPGQRGLSSSAGLYTLLYQQIADSIYFLKSHFLKQ